MLCRRILSLAFLLLTVLAATLAPAAAQEPAALAELGALVPAHHELHRFDGEPTWYEHRPLPAVGYQRPDFTAWAGALVPAQADPAATPFVAIWRNAGGDVRFVLARDEKVRLFSIDGDSIELEQPGFQTQLGVARWGWEYGDGLLRIARTWRFTLGPTGTDRPVGPPTPTALFAVTTYEYQRGGSVPQHSETFWSEEDRRAGRWGQRTRHGPDGRPVKVKQNRERPYPY